MIDTGFMSESRLLLSLGWMGLYRDKENPVSRRGHLDQGITVAIPTWNGANLLEGCFASLKSQERAPDRILVIDNASTDETREVVGRHPGIDYVRLRDNVGYSGAAYRAHAVVTTNYLSILNNDARPAPDWLSRLEKSLAASSDSGCAFPLSLFPNGSVDTAGDIVTKAGFFYKRGYNRRPEEVPPEANQFIAGPGVAPLYRVSALDDVGGWDRGLHSHTEDTDLGLRLWMGGWKCIYVPDARVVHLQGATTSTNIAVREFLFSRNEEIILFKLFPWRIIALILPARTVYILLSVMSRILRGRLVPYVAGKIAFWAGIPACLRARQRVTCPRRIAYHHLESSWLRTWKSLSSLGGRRAPTRS